jgi:hypothetical protein
MPSGPADPIAHDIVLRPCSEMRARRHPRAIAGVWIWQTVVAVVAAWPAANLARAAYGKGPRGDATLWDPGSHDLLDLLVHDAHGVSAVAAAASVTLVVAAVAGLVPMGALWVAIAHFTTTRRPVGLSRAVGTALQLLPSFALLLVIVGVVQALVLGAAFVARDLITASTLETLGEARAQQLGVTLSLLLILPALALGIVHDLARAAVVCLENRGLRALALGAAAFRRRPLPLAWSWLWRTGVSFAPVLAASTVASRIGGGGGVALVLLGLVHQLAVLTRISLRASWFAAALRSVGAFQRGNSDR